MDVKRQKVEEEALIALKILKDIDRNALNPPPRFTWNFAIFVELIEVINSGVLGEDVVMPHNNHKLYDILKQMEGSKGFTTFATNFEANDDYKNRFRKKILETTSYLKRIALSADSILKALHIRFEEYNDSSNLYLILCGDVTLFSFTKRMSVPMTYLFYCLPFLIHRKYWDNTKTFKANYIVFKETLTKEDYYKEMVTFVRDCVIANKKNIII